MFSEKGWFFLGWFFLGFFREQRQEKMAENGEKSRNRERPSGCFVETETRLVLADENGQLFSVLEVGGRE